MSKRAWWMFFAVAGIAAVIGLMFGGGARKKPGRSNEANNTQVGPAGFDRMSGANSKRQPANPPGDGADDSGARESSRHAVGEVERNRLQQERRQMETKMQLQAQLGSLLKYDDAQLAVYAAGLDLPDNAVREIHPKYMEAERKLEELKIAGMDDAHPTVEIQKEKLDELKRELDDGVVSLRKLLTAQLKLLEDRPPKATD